MGFHVFPTALARAAIAHFPGCLFLDESSTNAMINIYECVGLVLTDSVMAVATDVGVRPNLASYGTQIGQCQLALQLVRLQRVAQGMWQ